jgi:hypothetical protein
MGTSLSTHLGQPTTSIVEYQTTDLGETANAVRASLDGELHQVSPDNSNNSAMTYYKGFSEAVGSVTPGTTAPSLQIPVPAQSKVNMILLDAIDGVFTSDYTDCAVTTPGTAGNTGPSSQFNCDVIADA